MPLRPVRVPTASASRYQDLAFQDDLERGIADMAVPLQLDEGIARLRSMVAEPVGTTEAPAPTRRSPFPTPELPEIETAMPSLLPPRHQRPAATSDATVDFEEQGTTPVGQPFISGGTAARPELGMAPQSPAAGPRAAPTALGGPGAAPAAHAPSFGPIVGGNKADFLRTAGPIAAAVEAETGVPARLSLAVSANETGWGNPRYTPGGAYHGIQAQRGEAGTGYTDVTATGQPYQASLRSFDSPYAAFRGFADFLTGNPRYGPALARYQQTKDVNQLAADIKAAGYAEDPAYAGKIQSIMAGIPDIPAPAAPARTTAPSPASVPPDGVPTAVADGPGWRQTWGKDLTPHQINETLGLGLSWDAALATCGVAAAVAFARANGRTPTFGEALDLAKRTGEWNQEVGMTRGSTGELALLKGLGVDAEVRPLNEQEIATTVTAGQPVQINATGNGGHYYVAQGYDPATRRFDFGNSAAILKRSGGNTWYRLDELPGLGVGSPSQAIYLRRSGAGR